MQHTVKVYYFKWTPHFSAEEPSDFSQPISKDSLSYINNGNADEICSMKSRLFITYLKKNFFFTNSHKQHHYMFAMNVT